MDTATPITTNSAAEPVSPQEVTADPFTIYLQAYLTDRGLDEGFVKENITSEVVLDSFRDTQYTKLEPAKTRGATFAERNCDRVCTGHLQRYLVANGFKPEFAEQVTGPHLIDSVLDVMPDELLPKTPINQATSGRDSTINTVDAPRKDSAFAINSLDDDDDQDNDLSTKHRRMSKARYYKDRSRGRITKRTKSKSRRKLDLSRYYHEIKTASLASLELSEDSLFNANVSSKEYEDFLRDCSLFLASRFAAISVTLDRAGESQKALAFGQFGLDLVGPALFNASVALYEESEEVEGSMLYSRMSVLDCIDEISAQWDVALARELADLAKGHDMWWVKPSADI